MATSKKQPAKEPDKEDNQELQHGLPVSPSMPYYCTWLPGACPSGDNGPQPKANAQTIAFTHPPICPPPGAGAQTIVPTLVPPCPTMPQVCVPTINPACPSPGVGQANTQTATIITCTGIVIVCGHQPAQAQTFPTTTVQPSFFPPICPPNTATTTVQTIGGGHPHGTTFHATTLHGTTLHATTTVQTNVLGCTTVTSPPPNTHLMGCTTVTAPQHTVTAPQHTVGAQAQGFTIGGICGDVTKTITVTTVATGTIPTGTVVQATTGLLTQIAHCGAQAQTAPIQTQLLCPPTFPHTTQTLATVCTQTGQPGGLTQTLLSVGNICPTANAGCNTMATVCTQIACPGGGMSPQAITIGGICGDVTRTITVATTATGTIPTGTVVQATTGVLSHIVHCGAQAQASPVQTQLLCPPTFPHTTQTLATICTQTGQPGGLTQTFLSVGNICPTANAACNTIATVCTQIACPGHGTSPQGITIGGICGDVTRTITHVTTATGTIPTGTVVQATTGVLTHIAHCGAQAQGITIAGICGPVTKTITVTTAATGTIPTGTIIQRTTGILTQIANCGAQAQTSGLVTHPPICFSTLQSQPIMCHTQPLSAPPNCPLPPHGTQAQLITLNCTIIPIACAVTAVAKC